MVFTGHEYAEGADFIYKTLKKEKVKASFFLTGDFYRNINFHKTIKRLRRDHHYLGAHSDKHLLYCDWTKRDSLLVSKKGFFNDLTNNYKELSKHKIEREGAGFFMPPYEWYNDSIATWTKEMDLQLINFTPGTLSNADYTTPDMKNYRSSDIIYQSILNYESAKPAGLNGFILLLHLGTDPKRTDKFYFKLPELIGQLKTKGYQFQRIDELLKPD